MEDQSAKSSPLDYSSKPRRWPVRVVLFAACLVVAVVLAPSLVAWLGLAGPIASHLVGTSARIDVERASLAWWSPIVLGGVEVESKDGSWKGSIDEAKSARTLLALCLEPKRIGTVTLDGAVLHVSSESASVRQDDKKSKGSIVDATIGRGADAFEVEIELHNGSIVVEDRQTGATQTIQSIDGSLAVPGRDGSDAEFEVGGALASDGSRVEIASQVWVDRKSGKFSKAVGSLKSTDFPLDVMNPVLAVMGTDARVEGRLTCDTSLRVDGSLGVVEGGGRAQVAHFRCEAGLIEPDKIVLESIEASGDLRATREGLKIERGSLVCDVGRLTGRGEVDWLSDERHSIPSIVVEGNVDVSKLARMLPDAIGVREDVTIHAGELVFSVRPADGGVDRVDAMAEMRGLSAVAHGEPLEWPKPVSVSGRMGVDRVDGIVFDDIQCESDFVRAKGAGSISKFDLTAACDLGRVQERVGQLLDLGAYRLNGRLTARIQSERLADESVRIRGATKGESLDVQHAGEPIVKEPEVSAQFVALATTDETWTVDSCTLVAKSGSDSLKASLIGRLARGEATYGEWEVEGEGDLAEAVRRLQPWTGPLEGWKFAGKGKGTGRISWAGEQMRFESVGIELKDASFAGGGYRIDDPSVAIRTSGVWDMRSLAFTLGPTQLHATTGNGNWQQIRGGFGDSGLELAATGVVDFDVRKVRGWTLADRSQVDMGGQYVGNLDVEGKGGRWRGTAKGRVDSARYGVGDTPWIVESSADVGGSVTLDTVGDAMILEAVSLSIPGLSIAANGKISEWSSRQVISMDGSCEYDLAKLGPRVQAMLGSQVALEGRERRGFRVEGLLSSGEPGVEFASSTPTAVGAVPGLRGDFSLGWNRATFFGFLAGPAVAEGVLKESWLLTRPVQFGVNGGTVTLRPSLFLGRDKTYLHHPAGLVADHVRVTREMCDGALQYVAPVLAKSVDVAGDISLSISAVQFPLGSMDQADFGGTLVLHNVKATGSPVVRELLVLTEGQPVVDLAEESSVPFRVSQGRVHHENLVVRLPGLVVKTSGSVGFDQTLAIMAEMPIPKRWLGSGDVGKQLEGKSIRVPIGGTLEKPKLDQKALQRAIGQEVQQGIEKRIEKEVDKQIQKLFDRLGR